MNTPNNKRYRDMTESINAAFVSLLQNKELRDISVTDICELAGVERSTFYAHSTKMWFEEGCIEPPEQMSTIIKREYEKIYK